MMGVYSTDGKYISLKISERQRDGADGTSAASPRKADVSACVVKSDDLFYEIEYDSCPIPGIGKFVLKPQTITRPEKDEIRDLFDQMRGLCGARRFPYDRSGYIDVKTRHYNAAVFYKQAVFMKDFTDDYAEKIPFSSYYPYYQMMGYEQLRTYFTWRTQVRKGNVADTSVSYAFLYIYELLNNVGTDSPQDGLDKLMSFWNAFRVYNNTIDRYVLRWLKDYHIYYQLPHSFNEFVNKHGLAGYCPKPADLNDSFSLFCAMSKYDVRKSAFFAGDNVKLITDCFGFVIGRLRRVFDDNGISFDEHIYQSEKKMSEWTPFKDALFYHHLEQGDRRVVLSENEIYICKNNKFSFGKVLAADCGRQLLGYIMKQTESLLRKAVKYKYRLSADISGVPGALIEKLRKKGLSLEKIICDAVSEFYKESTKTIVRVDRAALIKIRQEALATQEKLIVTEPGEQFAPAISPLGPTSTSLRDIPPPSDEPLSAPDVWESLKNALTSLETEALSAVLGGETEIKKFADERGIMPEVLADGINEKAVDYIGDSLLDDQFVLYGEYIDQITKMVG